MVDSLRHNYFFLFAITYNYCSMRTRTKKRKMQRGGNLHGIQIVNATMKPADALYEFVFEGSPTVRLYTIGGQGIMFHVHNRHTMFATLPKFHNGTTRPVNDLLFKFSFLRGDHRRYSKLLPVMPIKEETFNEEILLQERVYKKTMDQMEPLTPTIVHLDFAEDANRYFQYMLDRASNNGGVDPQLVRSHLQQTLTTDQEQKMHQYLKQMSTVSSGKVSRSATILQYLRQVMRDTTENRNVQMGMVAMEFVNYDNYTPIQNLLMKDPSMEIELKSAVAYSLLRIAQKSGVLHGDMKLDNFLGKWNHETNLYDVVVIDFGYAMQMNTRQLMMFRRLMTERNYSDAIFFYYEQFLKTLGKRHQTRYQWFMQLGYQTFELERYFTTPHSTRPSLRSHDSRSLRIFSRKKRSRKEAMMDTASEGSSDDEYLWRDDQEVIDLT